MREGNHMPGLDITALERIGPLDADAVVAARERQQRLTKPAGSLGALEELSVRLAGLAGQCPPPVPQRPALAIFAGDHGVHAQGVTPWPQEVTGQMVANFVAGGAVANAFAAQVGATVTVTDVGVAHPLLAGEPDRRIRAGTRDFTLGPAMTLGEATAAIATGMAVANELIDAGHDCLLTGDMGIGNTTPAAALIAAFTGAAPAAVTGRGTGVDDVMLAHKTEVIAGALLRHRPDRADPVAALAAVGGLEHAALAGFILGSASRRVPVLLDGVIACSAERCPATMALRHLGLEPLVDLGLRLGEGTGALLAFPIVASAVRVLRDVATFDSAGVAEK